MKINEKNLAAFASSATPVDREGWLVKRGEVNKGYQKRWFVLKGNLLFYFEKRGDKEPVGVIILEGCTIELAEDEDQFGFKIVFHGPGNRSYVLGAESQESMEQWMKALACASYDYMKLMVAELQRQLDEMEECEVLSKNASKKTTPESREHKPSDSPLPPPRQRHNPFNRIQPATSLDGQNGSGFPHHFRSHSIRSAPGRSDGTYRSYENVPRTKVTFRDLHTAYGRRVLTDFNAWRHSKRLEQEKKQVAESSQDLLITL
ncbi:sesquipedalian-1-like [Schistocerca americana]|uniref:sesquipedalian-1-like n=1 Tax=Schistocerca americana TaxID=7009 RepID=UPI001F501EA5|nr:sesquipedalian-1-like [Schistocerca americana]XP_049951971.1 sesquipedalian-1-like [Schistocerca serialis cubense]